MPYLSASVVVIHYEEALYQVYGPLPFYLLLLHFVTASWVMEGTAVHYSSQLASSVSTDCNRTMFIKTVPFFDLI